MGNKNTKYNATADEIRKYIDDNKLLPGHKLPTYRELSEIFNVSYFTVNTALDLLSAEGIVDVRPNSGAYVAGDAWRKLNPKTIEWSNYLYNGMYQADSKEYDKIGATFLRAEKIQLSNITVPEEAPWLPLFKLGMAHAFESVDRPNILNEYNEFKGYYPLRESICTHLESSGITANPDEICITHGLLEAVLLISLAFFRNGMYCYFDHPSYIDSFTIVRHTGMHMVPVPLDNEGLSFDYIVSKLQKNQKSLIITYPTEQYPTGISMSMKRKQQLATLSVERKIPLLELDPLRDVIPQKTPPIKAFDSSGNVMYVGTFTKALSRSMRVGYIVAPSYVVLRISQLRSDLTGMTSNLLQIAMNHILSSGDYAAYLKQLHTIVQERSDMVNALLDEHFSDIATWNKTSTMLRWLEFNEHIDTRRILSMQDEIFFHTGATFDPDDTRHILICTTDQSVEKLKKALLILAKYAHMAIKKV